MYEPDGPHACCLSALLERQERINCFKKLHKAEDYSSQEMCAK